MKHAPAVLAKRCFNCALLDMRALKGGRVVYWCLRRSSPLPDSFVWRRDCRHFVAIDSPPRDN